MKIKKYLIGSFVTLGLLLASFILLSPYLLESKHIRAQALTLLSNWVGGDIKINGPIDVRYFFGARFQANGIEITGVGSHSPINSISIDSLNANISWLSLLQRKVEINHLSLVNPKIITKRHTYHTKDTDFDQYKSHPLSKLIRRASVKHIDITDGHIEFNLFQQTHKIENINSRLYIGKRFGGIRGSGNFNWKNQKTDYNINTFRTDSPTEIHTENSKKLNINLLLANPIFDIRLNGLLDFAKELLFEGKHDLKVSDINSLSQLFNIKMPLISGLQNLETKSKVALQDKKITFNEGTFILDGNAANGNLAFQFRDRPKIDGSLALTKLSLEPYLSHKNKQLIKSEYSLSPFRDFLNSLDIDLVVSTDQILTSNFSAGNSIIAISMNSKKFYADIAEIELCEGSANGLIEIRNSIEPILSVHGNLRDIATDECMQQFFPQKMVKGKASAEFLFSAKGDNWNSWVSHLSGKWTLDMPNGGSLKVDLPQLIKVADSQKLQDWSELTKTPAQFDNLKLSFDMIGGMANINSLILINNTKSYSGYGKIHFKDKKIDYTLTEKNITINGIRPKTKNVLNIHGSLITPSKQ